MRLDSFVNLFRSLGRQSTSEAHRKLIFYLSIPGIEGLSLAYENRSNQSWGNVPRCVHCTVIYSSQTARVPVQRLVLVDHSPYIGVCLTWRDTVRLVALKRQQNNLVKFISFFTPITINVYFKTLACYLNNLEEDIDYFLLGSWLPPVTFQLSIHVDRCCRVLRPCS